MKKRREIGGEFAFYAFENETRNHFYRKFFIDRIKIRSNSESFRNKESLKILRKDFFLKNFLNSNFFSFLIKQKNIIFSFIKINMLNFSVFDYNKKIKNWKIFKYKRLYKNNYFIFDFKKSLKVKLKNVNYLFK